MAQVKWPADAFIYAANLDWLVWNIEDGNDEFMSEVEPEDADEWAQTVKVAQRIVADHQGLMSFNNFEFVHDAQSVFVDYDEFASADILAVCFHEAMRKYGLTEGVAITAPWSAWLVNQHDIESISFEDTVADALKAFNASYQGFAGKEVAHA
ncbi:hypothetical protein [Magnetospirillum sp. 15-1]|uniref:hypothetical protein n=1 Tax=Magnetospirillum sp. 15-1 TaxID=1979370 RepID=UPI00114518D3|nr:hypothetical protein [Magnetospirillum sp. 15-1]